MRAEAAVQRRLVDLADLDLRIAGLSHRRAALAEQAEVDRLEGERRTARESAARARIAVEDLDRAIAKLDSDVEAVRRRRERDEALVAGGELPARQVVEVEHELGTLARREAALGDERAELDERRSALTADVEHSGATVSDLDRRLEDAVGARDAALADLDEAARSAQGERERLRSDLPADLLDLYTRTADSVGVGAGLLSGGRCTACAMVLDRASLSGLHSADADDVLCCPECGAVLVRPEVLA